jgi:GNAT superfamily N-acetyltransferase
VRGVAIAPAAEADAEAIAAVSNSAAEALTERYGRGHWSGRCTARGVLFGLKSSRGLVARRGGAIVGVLRLTTRKPWAIDVAYFSPAARAVYLVGMAVAPEWQGRGIGRRLVAAAIEAARAWPADALRLDAYDSPAGAGPFYAKCGFREVARVVYKGNPLVYYETTPDGADLGGPSTRPVPRPEIGGDA